MPGEKDRFEINRLLAQTDAASVVAVIAEASTHDLVDLRGMLTVEMFGYLRETEKLAKSDLRRLRSAEAGWVSAIDAELDRQRGDSGDRPVVNDAEVARAKPAAEKSAPKKPVAVKRSSGGGPPFTRNKPRTTR